MNVIVVHEMELVSSDHWRCKECDREQFYDPKEKVWITINKGDQSTNVMHQGIVGGLQMGGSVEEA